MTTKALAAGNILDPDFTVADGTQNLIRVPDQLTIGNGLAKFRAHIDRVDAANE